LVTKPAPPSDHIPLRRRCGFRSRSKTARRSSAQNQATK